MSYPDITQLNFRPAFIQVGSQSIGAASATQAAALGASIEAADAGSLQLGQAEFLYLAGASGTAAGDLVFYDQKAGTTTRSTANSAASSGPAAIAMASTGIGQFGWYCVRGGVPVNASAASANGVVYMSPTPGQVSTSPIAGAAMSGMVFKGSPSGGFAICQVSAPCLAEGSSSSGSEYTTAAASALPSNTLTVDLSGNAFYSTLLDHDLTVGAPTGYPTINNKVRFTFRQDGTGGRNVTWNAAFALGATFMPRQGAGQLSSVEFVSNGDGTFTLLDIDGIDVSRPLDIRDFGAVDTYVNGSGFDCAPAINAAIAAAATLLTEGRTVYIPDGLWQQQSPVVVSANNIKIQGQSRTHTKLLQGGAWSGPQILVIPTAGMGWVKPTIGAALATGSGGSWPLDGTSNYWVDYSQTHTIRLDGLSQFCLEFYTKLTATTAGAFFGSRGGLGAGAGHFATHYSLRFFVNGDDGTGKARIAATVDIGGTHQTVNSSSGITLNAVHHLALTYDGSTLRLFVDGVSSGTQAATGNVVQNIWENFILGQEQEMNGGVDNPMPFGSIDSIRLSKTARYTSGFAAPTAKFSVDSNTLFLHNFEIETPSCTAVHVQEFVSGAAAGIRTTYLPSMYAAVADLMGYVDVSDLHLSSSGMQASGIWTFALVNGLFDRLFLEAGGGGLRFDGQSFLNRPRDVEVDSGALTANTTNAWPPKFGVYHGAASGAGTSQNVTVNGYVYQYFMNGGIQPLINQLWCNPGSDTIYSLVAETSSTIRGDSSFTLHGLDVDDEALLPSYLGAVYALGIGNFHILGGNIDISTAGGGDGHPHLTLSGCGAVNAHGVAFGSGFSTPYIVHSLDQTTFVNLVGCWWEHVQTLWSDDPAHLSILDGSVSTNLTSVNHAASPYSVGEFGELFVCDATAGTITFDLPAANANGKGSRKLTIKKKDSSGNAVTVTAAGSDKIDGSGTYSLSAQYKYVDLISDGSANWLVVGSN